VSNYSSSIEIILNENTNIYKDLNQINSITPLFLKHKQSNNQQENNNNNHNNHNNTIQEENEDKVEISVYEEQPKDIAENTLDNLDAEEVEDADLNADADPNTDPNADNEFNTDLCSDGEEEGNLDHNKYDNINTHYLNSKAQTTVNTIKNKIINNDNEVTKAINHNSKEQFHIIIKKVDNDKKDIITDKMKIFLDI